MVVRDVVVVGAAAAGLTTAEALRRAGYDGKLTMIGAEEHLPYDRPPLSKQILAGTWERDKINLRQPDMLSTLDAEWLLGSPATGLDVTARQVTLGNGTVVGYDGLVIATGVTPRQLPFGHELSGVHTLRTVDDALALRERLTEGTRLVVVGCGFLGAETAAVAAGLGADVTLVDPLPAPMIRQFGATIGGEIAKLHQSHGVKVLTSIGVAGISGIGGRVTSVALDDGRTLPADVVLVAIGSVPATGWLADSGLSLGNGIDCDEQLQAAPGIVAAGDVASWPHPHLDERIRLEHRMNATEQGLAAANTLLGKGTPFAPVPYFWTDQYDVKIQAYGTFPADAELAYIDGTPEDGKFTAEYRRGARVYGVLGWNMPKQTRTLRARILDTIEATAVA
ncbi:MAG TPA: FAD/NAD(P)-binding oxidoreductase [Pseudonocardiaceae bacterium]|jgi:NADPH-dependent 2,4-dienoyl-CoA reductase/sulfur reductase-like enzyme